MSYIGHEYFCPICKTFFLANKEQLDEVYLQHESGEELTVVTVECFTCKSMLIPEGMNTIAWLKENLNE